MKKSILIVAALFFIVGASFAQYNRRSSMGQPSDLAQARRGHLTKRTITRSQQAQRMLLQQQPLKSSSFCYIFQLLQ